MSLRCWLGRHDWLVGRWSGVIERRTCQRCRRVQLRFRDYAWVEGR